MKARRNGFVRWLCWSLCCITLSVFSCTEQVPPTEPLPIDAGRTELRSPEPRKESTNEAIVERKLQERKPDAKSPSVVSLKRDDAAIQVQQKPWQLRVLRDQEVLSSLDLSGLRLGVVPEYDKDYNYDPHWLSPPHGTAAEPPDLKWFQPTSIVLKEKTSTSVLFHLQYPEKIEWTLRIVIHSKGTFSLQWKPKKDDPRVVYKRVRWNVEPKENYYGLGEYFDQVAHRGTIRAMQIEADFKLESAYNEAHFPVPFFTGTRAWGFFVRSYALGTFDMGRKDPKKVEVTYHAPALDMFIFVAKHPLDVPGLYTRITGAPAVPARWAFGTLLWRDENKDQAEVLEDAAQIRKHDLAISALWIDRPYDTAVNNFSFDTKRYPDVKQMIQTLHQQGFRLGVWSTPYLEPKSDAHALFKTNNWFVKGTLKANKWSAPVDLTHPAAFQAWQKQIDKLVKLGIQGFKLDYAEDIQVGLQTGRFHFQFHNGENEITMHHKYALYYHKAYYERLPKNDGFLICRGGTFGSQVYATIVWPGDLDADFRKHRSCEGGTCHVGGLIASIIGGLSLSQSGFPFYGADTGGYRHARPTKEVMMRWGQQTALSTIMQIGGTDPNANPWDFKTYGRSTFDQDVLDMYRRYIRLHTRLFPYIYTYALAAHAHRPGPTRPYGMMFPKEGYHPNDIYFLGDFLMVAPVVRAARKRTIQFPKAYDWIDWWDQKKYKGGSQIDYVAPLDRLPLFLRVGSIVPLLRPDVDTLSISKDPKVVSVHKDKGDLYVRVVPGKDTDWTLFDATHIEMKHRGGLQISIRPGKEFKQGTVFEVLRLQSVQVVRDGKTALKAAKHKTEWATCTSCWFWEAAKKRLWIRLPSTQHTLSIQASIQP